MRFIAVTNGVDSEKPDTLEFAPFINIMSEWYAKKIRKKGKTGIKTKRHERNADCHRSPYGYMKGPDNKDFWIIDEETAEVVRLIFRLFIGGKRHVAYCSEYHKGKAKNPKCHSPHIMDADLLIQTIAEVLKKIEDYSISSRAEFEALVKKILAIGSSPMDHFHGAVVRSAGYMCVNRKLPLIWQLFLIIRYVIPARGTFVGIIYFHYKQGRKLVTGVPETMRGIGGYIVVSPFRRWRSSSGPWESGCIASSKLPSSTSTYSKPP